MTFLPTAQVHTDAESILLKRQLLAAKRRRVDLIKQDGLPFYRPHPKQDAFHRSVAKRRGAFTGNRFGKSTMGCAEDCAWLRGERTWLPQSDPGRKAGIPQHPVKGLIIVNDWDKAKEIWSGQDGKLWQFLPRDGFIKNVSRNHSGAIDTVICHSPFGGGLSALRFDTDRSFASNPQGSESSDWDFIHIDEPCSEQMWKAQSRGLVDRNGSAWFTLTALKEPWITDAFGLGGSFKDSFSVTGSIYDNIYLPPEAIETFKNDLTTEEQDCRLWGLPLHLAGLIYKQFDKNIHLLKDLPPGWESWSKPPKTYSYYYYIDPHPKTPHMVLMVAVSPEGVIYVYHDIFEKGRIRDLCNNMRNVLSGRKPIRGRIDPIAYIKDPEDDSTWADTFAEHGFPVDRAIKDPLHGIEAVQEMLESKPRKLLFCPGAKRTLWEISRYHWDEETNKPVDADDHAMECLYRMVLDKPCWVNPRWQNVSIDMITLDKTPPLTLDDVAFAQ